MYYPIKLKKITKNSINNIDIDEDLLNELLLKNIIECPYSTFPYMMGKNSKESQEQYGCGNCVAMSINLQKMLKKHNIKSKLVPATIPKMYYMPDFLDISHVAVLILKNDQEAYLIDPAFYFLAPMKININDRENNEIPWKNVYRGDEEDLTYNLQHLNHDLKYNDYQTIPKNTYMIETFRTNDPSDKWHYYLSEITNPDNAITSFNLTSKKFPFMAALDEQLNLKLFIKYIDRDNLKIKYDGNEVYNGNYDNIPDDIMETMNPHLSKHFGKSYKKSIKCPASADTKIYRLTDHNRISKKKKRNSSTKKKKKHSKKKNRSVKFKTNVSYI
tara:strand:+ start:136 stop:1125 length:990 start_codon:yes stop_codon:yes gene_type:complete